METVPDYWVSMKVVNVDRFRFYFFLFLTVFPWCSCVVGGAQISSGRLQHAGVDLCRRRGVGYRRGRPHRLLRRTEEPHPPRAANGPHRS